MCETEKSGKMKNRFTLLDVIAATTELKKLRGKEIYLFIWSWFFQECVSTTSTISTTKRTLSNCLEPTRKQWSSSNRAQNCIRRSTTGRNLRLPLRFQWSWGNISIRKGRRWHFACEFQGSLNFQTHRHPCRRIRSSRRADLRNWRANEQVNCGALRQRKRGAHWPWTDDFEHSESQNWQRNVEPAGCSGKVSVHQWG